MLRALFLACGLVSVNGWSATLFNCGDSVILGTVAREASLPFQPGEMIFHPNELALVGTPLRIVAGTAISARGTVTGGRLLGIEVGATEPSLSLEIPGGNRGPIGVQAFRVSANGSLVAASGGHFAGGPLVVYDLTTNRLVFSKYSQRNSFTKYLDVIKREFVTALLGDDGAAGQLEMIGVVVSPEMREAYAQMGPERRAEFMSTVEPDLRALVGRVYGTLVVDRNEDIPTVGADFSPDGTLFLADSIDNVEIGRVTDRTTVQRLQPELGVGEPLPPSGVSRFFGGGKEVVTFHREGMTVLWDIATGQAAHVLKLGFEPDFSAARPVVVSPNADFFAVCGRTATDDITEVWTSDRSAARPQLTRVKQWKSPSPGEDKDLYRAVAFASSGDFVVGDPDGTAVIYSAENYKPRAELKGAHAARVSVTAFATDGSATATLSPTDGTVGLWPANGKGKPIALKWEGPGTPAAVNFSPDGRHLLVEVREIKSGQITFRAFVVDVRAVLDR